MEDPLSCLHGFFRLKDVPKKKIADEIKSELLFDISFPRFFREAYTKSFFANLEIEDVPQNALVYLDYVAIHLSNVWVYEATDAQLAMVMTREHLASCGHYRGIMFRYAVKRIYVANISIRTRWDRGFRGGVKDILDAKIRRALAYSYSGKRIVFAVTLEPVGGPLQ
ncbi:MAG: hypothetical protein KF750_00540 [Xanthobacteraceae bacterium]|nr:hypothetical protein [Xanthobacteraceae bacterium]